MLLDWQSHGLSTERWLDHPRSSALSGLSQLGVSLAWCFLLQIILVEWNFRCGLIHNGPSSNVWSRSLWAASHAGCYRSSYFVTAPTNRSMLHGTVRRMKRLTGSNPRIFSFLVSGVINIPQPWLCYSWCPNAS